MPKKPSKPKPKPKTATKTAKQQTKPKPIKQTHLKPKAQIRPKTRKPQSEPRLEAKMQIVPSEPEPTLEEWDLRVEQARAAFDAAAKALEDAQRNEQLELSAASEATRSDTG